MLSALIMAGGSGQRFWPLSTEERPKQLLKLFSEKSMIRETVDRILPLINVDNIFIATNIKQVAGIKAELPMLKDDNIIVEPAFKDTAAAIGYGTQYITSRLGDSNIVVLASDHLIKDESSFRDTLELAAQESATNKTIVTLGIKPQYAETGYGYIEYKNDNSDKVVKAVNQFHEKPNLEKAQTFLDSGNFLWNSGMFIFHSDVIMDEIETHIPAHYSVLSEISKSLKSDKSGESLAKEVSSYFDKFEKISIDYGVMEKSNRIRVIPSDFGWNDIGSFNALKDVFTPDELGNIVKTTNHKSANSKDNVIITDQMTVGTIGVENLVIVQDGNNLLICHKDKVQDIKKIL